MTSFDRDQSVGKNTWVRDALRWHSVPDSVLKELVSKVAFSKMYPGITVINVSVTYRRWAPTKNNNKKTTTLQPAQQWYSVDRKLPRLQMTSYLERKRKIYYTVHGSDNQDYKSLGGYSAILYCTVLHCTLNWYVVFTSCTLMQTFYSFVLFSLSCAFLY